MGYYVRRTKEKIRQEKNVKQKEQRDALPEGEFNRRQRKRYYHDLPEEMINFRYDFDHARKLFYEISKTYEKEEHNSDTILEPITTEERKKAIKRFKKEMDPHATIYGCSSCGVWVIRNKSKQPYQRSLSSLELLHLSAKDLDYY